MHSTLVAAWASPASFAGYAGWWRSASNMKMSATAGGPAMYFMRRASPAANKGENSGRRGCNGQHDTEGEGTLPRICRYTRRVSMIPLAVNISATKFNFPTSDSRQLILRYMSTLVSLRDRRHKLNTDITMKREILSIKDIVHTFT